MFCVFLKTPGLWSLVEGPIFKEPSDGRFFKFKVKANFVKKKYIFLDLFYILDF